MTVWIRLKCAFAFCNHVSALFFFFFFKPHYFTKSTVNSARMHCSQTHKFHFSATFSLKMGPTILFTHLKIILLQYFQFQFSISAKISLIQTDPWFWFHCFDLLNWWVFWVSRRWIMGWLAVGRNLKFCIYISKSVQFGVHRNPKTFVNNRTGRRWCLKITTNHRA